MNRIALAFCISAITMVLPVSAQDVPTPAFLPTTAQANAWIDADPSVRAARSSAEASRHGSAAVAASSHEWTARVQGQRRHYQDSGSKSGEWSAQIERTFRVNGKAGLDGQIRDVEEDIGHARVGEAKHEAARALADLWIETIAAQRRRALMQEQLAAAQGNLDTVMKRQRAGDASSLDVNVARTDLGEVQREASRASTEHAKLEATLRARFSAAAPDAAALPEPNPPIWPVARWRERVMAEADPVKTAEGGLRKSRLTASRARADRVPDPTVAVYTANEALHNERIVGLSLSIPLSGTYRAERSLQAEKEADAAQAGVDAARLDLEVEMSQTWAEATGSLDRWRVARDAAATAAESGRLMQRAYALGEAGLESLLMSRRQSLEAARAAIDAQAEAVRWEQRLLIDAHLIWDLARE